MECPICQEHFTDPVVASCGHEFCKQCISKLSESVFPLKCAEPSVTAERIRNMAEDSGDDPAEAGPRCPWAHCKAAISEQALFSREVFEPTEAELMPEEPPMTFPTRGSSSEAPETRPSRRSSRKRKPARRVIDSDEDFIDDDEDLSDFIVQSDEDEEEKDVRREVKQRLSKGKRSARQIVDDSDDEYDEDIIHGAKPDFVATPEQVALMPRFLPSTKMKVNILFHAKHSTRSLTLFKCRL